MASASRAQQEQQDRSWYIFRLRGLYDQASMIRNPHRRKVMQDIVDVELKSIGAESQTDRREKLRVLSQKMSEGDEAARVEYNRLTKNNFSKQGHRVPF